MPSTSKPLDKTSHTIHTGRISKSTPTKSATAMLMNNRLAVVETKPNKTAINMLATMMTSVLFRSDGLTVEFILLAMPEGMMTLNFMVLEIVNAGFWYFVS